MAGRNDFKLLNLYSMMMFKKMIGNGKYIDLEDIKKQRFGFYFLILQLTTGKTSFDELEQMIIDTEYSKVIRNEKNNDFGIDAVYIDDYDRKIILYNFKFRENFKDGGKQSPILDSTKFINMCLNNGYDDITDSSLRSKTLIKKISDIIDSDEIWNIELIIVSNENNCVDVNSPEIVNIKKNYDIEINPISIDEIMSFLHDNKNEITSQFIVDTKSMLVYEEDSFSSTKSYLVKLSVLNLIRITCSDMDIRNKYDYDNSDVLKELKLDMGVLYENVRGYLGNTKYNKNIINTLSECPNRFFMFNNGITITAKDVGVEQKNANTKYLFKLKGMQIVNGGQTLRSIYKFKDIEFNDEKLENAAVLVRIFKTEDNFELTNAIAEYTNSQNAISDADLKSINAVQIKIEKFLAENRIEYVRKSGDIGKDSDFDYRISKEELAQILYSSKGYPDRATNQKSKLFGVYYNEIFGEDVINYDEILNLIILYNEIKSKYNEMYSEKEVYNQKYFYIIYLQMKRDDIEKNINFLEKELNAFKKDVDISKARKLIQSAFREHIDKKFRNEVK